MAVAHDVNTRFPATDGTGFDTTTGNRTFTHSPAGDPKGVVVFVLCTGTTSVLSGVSYGGVQMRLLNSATDTSEAGRVDMFVLSNSIIPVGGQFVVLQGCTATQKWCTVSTVTAATNATNINQSGIVNTTTSTNPTISLATSLTTQCYAAFHSGAPAIGTALAGCTLQHSGDYGALCSQTVRRTAADASGTILTGVTLASDDWCGAGVAFAELQLNDLPSLVMGVNL